MRRLVLLLLLSLMTADVSAQSLTFQGVLRDPTGRTVEDDDYDLTCRLYDAERGGNELWTEMLTQVPIRHGVFSIELGKTNPIGSLPFDRPYWLGIAVYGGQELPVRMRLDNTPYSISALGSSNRFPSRGNVGVGVTDPGTGLYVSSANDTYVALNSASSDSAVYAIDAGGVRRWEVRREQADNSLRITESGQGDALTVQPGGKVGAGRADPVSTLHVSGDGLGNVNLTVDGRIRSAGDSSGLWVGSDRLVGGRGTDKVGIYTGGDWRLTVQPDGSVGIGTTSPTDTLDVAGNVKLSSGGAVMFNDGTSIATSAVGGSAESVTNSGAVVITADNDRDKTGSAQVMTGGTTRLTVANDGKVGIATTTPSRKLDVAGDINLTGQLLRSGQPYASTPWVTSGSNIYYNYTGGKAGIGMPNPSYTLDVNGTINATDIYKNGSAVSDPWLYATSTKVYYPYYAVIGYDTTYNYTAADFSEPGYGDMNLTVYAGTDGRVVVYKPPGGTTFPHNIDIKYNDISTTENNAGRLGWFYSSQSNNPMSAIWAWNTYRNSAESFSDRTTKENIHPISDALDKVSRIKGVQYDVNTATHPFFKGREIGEDERTRDLYGFVAQDLKEVFPQLVDYNEDAQLYTIRNESQLLAVMVEALKELKVKNDALKERARIVRQRLQSLEGTM